MSNCKMVAREGRCDGKMWLECSYCGALDNDPCLNVKKAVEAPNIEDQIKDGLATMAAGWSATPYQLQAIVFALHKKVEELERKTHTFEVDKNSTTRRKD